MARPTVTDYETYPGEYADIEGAAPRAEGLDAHRLGGLIERAIRDSKRQSGGLLPDGWTLVEMALAYPPETPTEPSQSIPSRPSDEREGATDDR